MCLVAFQKMFWKIFSSVWLCSWKYHRKHIFYLLLTFSRLPNEYIISFIAQYRNTNKTQERNHQILSHFLTVSLLPNKYVISFIPQYRNTEKTQKKKKSSNPVKLREEGRERGDWVRRGAAIGTKARLRSARCFARSRSARCFARSLSAQCFARSRSAWRRDHDRRRDLSPFARMWVVLSLSLSPFAHLWAPLFARLSSGSDLKVK